MAPHAFDRVEYEKRNSARSNLAADKTPVNTLPSVIVRLKLIEKMLL